MKIRGNLLQVFFGINLLLFVFSVFSPWAWKTGSPMVVLDDFIFPVQGEEYYWSFQVVLHPYRYGYRTIPWDFLFGPYGRVLLWEFWFSRNMYYYGFTYEWIQVFIFQMLTVFSGVFVLFRRWQRTNFMLVPVLFSVLCIVAGLLLIARFAFITNDAAKPAWGLPAAVFSVLFFLTLFLVRYALEKKKCATLISSTGL